MLIRSLASVINGTNYYVVGCDATGCYSRLSSFSHGFKDPRQQSLKRKTPEKQHRNGFSKSVRLSEQSSRGLDKQFPLFSCWGFFFFAHSTVSCLKLLVSRETTRSENTYADLVPEISRSGAFPAGEATEHNQYWSNVGFLASPHDKCPRKLSGGEKCPLGFCHCGRVCVSSGTVTHHSQPACF